ncbi:MAG: type II toxin-antitoxin system RelE family toxin [Daejeonella sp.]
MEIDFDRSFKKDSIDLPIHIRKAISILISEVKKTQTLSSISGIKKLKGYKAYYRARIGDYRIGLYMDKDTVVFSRALHRKDIYKYFP